MRRRLALPARLPHLSRRVLLWLAVGAFVAATGLTYALDRVLPVASLGAWLYLPFVLLVTIRWGLARGIGAALLADLLILFIAIEPFGTLVATDPTEYVRLGVAAVGLLIAVVFVWFLHQRSLSVERAFAAQTERTEALEARDAFLAAVSHDLRTPLTSIRAGTQLLRRALSRLAGPQQELVTTSLTEMDRAIRSMGRMIDDLLDLSRLERGQPLVLNRERLDLIALVRRVVEDQQRAAEGHHLTIETALDELIGCWSPSQMERVVVNLLSNAVKYSPAGRKVTVTIATFCSEGSDESWAEVRVADEGLGIPVADVPYIFERFRRARNVSGRVHGLGIGLAGVKQIVEQHGGSISVESEEGRGSVFTVRLPREDIKEDPC